MRFVNAPMEKLLGRRFDELSTTRWLAMCVQPGGTSTVKHLLGAGFRGEATVGDLPLLTREGRRITMRAELSRETRGRRRALVVVSQGVREVEPARACGGLLVRGVEDRHGGGDRLAGPLPRPDPRLARSTSGVPSRSFSSSSAVPRPCAGSARCSPSARPKPARSSCPRPTTRSGSSPRSRSDDATAARDRPLPPDALLPELVDAKAARTAGEGALSERERQVLTLLLRGRGVEDIATMLEIAPRTVKFHQANVLQKLGADSRLESPPRHPLAPLRDPRFARRHQTADGMNRRRRPVPWRERKE